MDETIFIDHQTMSQVLDQVLLKAVEDKDIKEVEKFVSRHHIVYLSKGSEGYDLLHKAVQCGHHDIVFFLLQKGAQVHTSRSLMDLSLLHYAAKTHGKKSLEIVEFLLDSKVSINALTKSENTPLHFATLEQNVEMVRLLLDKGASSSLVNISGNTPLHLAAVRGYQEIISLLLSKRVKKTTPNKGGNTALHLAAENGHATIINMLLKEGKDKAIYKANEIPSCSTAYSGQKSFPRLLFNNSAKVDATNMGGKTPLHLATCNGHESAMEVLLNYEANLEAADAFGYTALHMATSENHENCVEMLLKRGANIDAKTKKSTTPLMFSARNGHPRIVQLLLDNGANVNAVDEEHNTPLLYAAKHGHCIIVKMLLKYKANVDASTKDGKTCLHLAAQKGYEKIVEVLFNNAADLNASDENDETALHTAARAKYSRIVEFLMNRGADINAANKSGETALLLSCNSRHVTVKALVENKANVLVKNKDGQTPLHLVAKYGCGITTSFLLENGADINARDKDGNTPLHFAVHIGRQENVRVLLDNEANVDATNELGDAPITLANNSCIIKVLLSFSAKVDVQGKSKKTALHKAVEREDVNSSIYLLSCAIDTSLESDAGQTALQVAISQRPGSTNLDQIIMDLKEHTIKLSTAGLHVSDKDLNLLHTRYVDKLRRFEHSCKMELENLKEETLSRHLTLYDILTSRIPKFAENDLLMRRLSSRSFQKFPLYRSLILKSIATSKRRLAFITMSMNSLKFLLKTGNLFVERKLPNLPDELIEKIVAHLNNEDLDSLNLCRKEIVKDRSSFVPHNRFISYRAIT